MSTSIDFLSSAGILTAPSFTVKQGGVVWPVPGYSALPGSVRAGHEALDIPAPIGTPVLAAKAGLVKVETGQYGKTVRVQDLATGLEVIYGHLSAILVKTGEIVNPGVLLGKVGNTGKFAMQPHLHFEVNPIGPEHFSGGLSDINAVDPVAFLRGATQVSVPSYAAPSFTPTPAPSAAITISGLAPGSPAPAKPKASTSTNALGQDTSVIQLGSVGMPGGTTSSQAKSAIAANPPAAKGGLPFGIGEALVTRASTYAKRTGFVVAGSLLVMVGLAMFAFTYRDAIGEASAKFAGTAAKAAVAV